MDSQSTIGRYQIKGELGRGGMATVYHAYDPRFERDVAVKILPHAFLHDPQFRARFEREAKTIAMLEHPAIVPVYDFGEQEGQPYIVMRLMSGGTLTDRLEHGALTQQESTRIISRIAPALDAAHAQGIIHRDLKPGNILFDQYGNAYLSDFGIAQLSQASAHLTGSAIIGTPAYMSPEQVQGEGQVGAASDIYALGVILFQMLVGDMPYQADTPAKVMMMHLLEPVPQVSALRPNLPPACSEVIARAMAKEPGERYTTAAQMAARLEAAALGQTVEASTMVTSPPETETVVVSSPEAAEIHAPTRLEAPSPVVEAPPVSPPASSRLGLWIGFVVVLALVASGGLWLAGRQGSGPLAFLAVPPATIDLPPSQTPRPSETPLPSSTAAPVAAVDTPTPMAEASSTEEPSPVPTDTPLPTATPTQTPSGPILGGADKIAFINANDVWVANLDGTDLVQLTVDGASKSNLQWTPDGREIAYVVGKCLQAVELESGRINLLACFEVAEFLEGFAISPDGSQLAISLNRELYVVPFDRERLSQARYYTDLQAMNECPALNPFMESDRNPLPVKSVQWSADSRGMAVVFLAAIEGLQKDLVRRVDISNCQLKPDRLDEFPIPRFTMSGYDRNPVIQNFSWDGEFLFALTGFVRNDGFGDLYLYNGDTYKAEMINPIDGVCCYRDPGWSPDSRYMAFAFQDIRQGAQSIIQLYVIPVGTLGTGLAYEPVPLPADFLADPRSKPQPALRPVGN